MDPTPLSAQSSAPDTTARRVDALLAHYGESHQHPTNELIHFTAIPLIMLSLVGMIYAANAWVAMAFLAASMVYYIRLGSPVLTGTMAIATLAMLGIIRLLEQYGVLLPVCIGVFVVAWIFQFIGHKIEGKKPSFFEDIQYLWVGPLFVLTQLFRRIGVRW